MSHFSVSSWFYEQTLNKSPSNIVRKFTMGNSDYSNEVLRWPAFSKTWDDIRPTNVTISLSNEGQIFNFIREDKTTLSSSCSIELGYDGYDGNRVGQDFLVTTWSRTTSEMVAGHHYLVDSSLTVSNFIQGTIVKSGDGNLGLNSTFKVQALIPIDSSFAGSGYAAIVMNQSIVNSEHSNDYGTVGFFTDGSSWSRFGTNVDSSNTSVASTSIDGVGYLDVLLTCVFSDATNDVVYVNIYPSYGTTFGVQDIAVGSVVVNSIYAVSSDTFPVNSEQTITLHTGLLEHVKYRRGAVELTVSDKFRQLTERVVGTDDVPVDYTGSSYLPSDLTWYLCTSYGGYSAVQSTSNPDIDYDSFSEWANVFSTSSILMNGYFTGQKVSECVRKIGRQTRSAIFVINDKLYFKRFSVADSYSTSLDDSTIVDLELDISDDEVVNKQYVFADYSVSSDFFQITIFDQSTSSVNSFGLKEETEKDENIWYVNTISALDLAQRIVNTNKVPFDKIEVDTTLVGVLRVIGETVSVCDSFHGIDEGFRIMGQRIDMDTGDVSFIADRSQFLNAFILDTSSLNGSDVLT